MCRLCLRIIYVFFAFISYWNQLDEDVRLLLQRFDAESADESGKQSKAHYLLLFCP